MVIASHSANVLEVPKSVIFGDSGVDIFFIISGFVIGLASQRETNLPQFYWKRIIRIVPLYWIALALFFLLPHFMVNKEVTASNLIHSIFLFPKFEHGWWPLLFPAWTLSYEMFFYGVFGIVILRKDAFWPVVAGLVVFSLVRIPSNDSIFTQVVMLEFVAGLLVARFLPFMKRNEGLGLTLIFCAALTIGCNYKDVTNRVLYWGVPSLLLIIGALHLEERMKKIPHVLGEASYSMYLFHITIMTCARDGFFFFGIDLQAHRIIGMTMLFVMAVALGICIHLCIERPLLAFLRAKVLPRNRNALREKSST